MSGKFTEHLKRAAAIPPDAAAIDVVSSDRIRNFSRRLPYMVPFSPDKVVRLDDRYLEVLHHELSDHFEARAVQRVFIVRSIDEAVALAAWEEAREATPASLDSFIEQLKQLNGMLTGGVSTRRKAQISTAPDCAGVKIEFPEIDEVELQLHWLWQQVYCPTSAEMSSFLIATAALVILTNAHLFTDGNGRLSRAIFNHVLHRAGMPNDVYVPVYEFASRSRGGFLIRVRQAELRAEWGPLTEYVLNMLEICSRTSGAR